MSSRAVQSVEITNYNVLGTVRGVGPFDFHGRLQELAACASNQSPLFLKAVSKIVSRRR
jgi:hypothetical protein